MALTKAEKASIIKEFARDEKDTGSAEVQIAILTKEINDLTEHLKVHIHDFQDVDFKRRLDNVVVCYNI